MTSRRKNSYNQKYHRQLTRNPDFRVSPLSPREKYAGQTQRSCVMGDKKSKKDKNKSDKQKASKQEKVKEEQKNKQPKKSM
jgi:hypothetical protein